MADCRSVYAGSNPAAASTICQRRVTKTGYQNAAGDDIRKDVGVLSNIWFFL